MSKRSTSACLRALLAAPIAAGMSTAVVAQGTLASSAEVTGIEEVVVTARKREENLQDIPLSVATVNDETLAAVMSGGTDIRGLSDRVPSLNIESSFGRTFPRFYIRGLGNTDFDLNASQPVSLVYDEVVLENPILKGFPAFDIDRVEVLRGPQGTLFGRNTPAGIVKFDSVKPGSGRNYARISYGTYSTINAEGAVGADITDEFSVRFSGLWQHRDDWIDNVETSGDDDFEGYDDIVLVRDIPFSSHCEHHMVPFIGKVHVAYFPTDRVVGLSKLGRVVDVFAKRLQTQELMTAQIVSAINDALKPRGVAVMIEAEHLCMTIRGVHKHGSVTVTTQFSGVFRDDPAEQQRFLTLLRPSV